MMQVGLFDLSFPRLRDEEGRLERDLPAGAWRIPNGIRAQSGALTYDPWPSPLRWKLLKRARMGRGGRLLEEFVNLGDAPVSDIQRYAERFGVLGLCHHGLGLGNRWHAQENGGGCRPEKFGDRGAESIQYWRWWAALFRAMLECASELHDGKRGQAERWALMFTMNIRLASSLEPLCEPVPLREFKEAWLEFSRDDLWNRLVDVLNLTVLAQAALEPRCVSTKGQFEMRLVPGVAQSALFSVLAAELLAAITLARPFYTCSSCGRRYSPESLRHKPRTGTGRYCAGCGRGASMRAAQERRRSAMREALRLQQAGLSVRAIAERLTKKVDTVEGWLRKEV
jgi:hypothetical protein